jgi:hypothetical protein
VRKNRKSGVRNILVNDIAYTWLCSDHNCDGDGSNRLKVWRDRKLVLEELVTGDVSITPEIVSKKIKSL